jgi:hypothetical protein
LQKLQKMTKIGESIYKKSAKLEMVTGRFVDFYKKPLLRVFLKNSEIYLKNEKKCKSVWVEAAELKFCMNMLC